MPFIQSLFHRLPLGGLVYFALSLLSLHSSAWAIIVIEQGDFVSKVEALEDLAFDANSGDYVIPLPAQRAQFATLATTLLSGNLALADAQANALDYNLIQFTDLVSGDIYHGLTEQLVMGNPTRGWGSFFVNFAPLTNVLVQAPHPLFDTNSPQIAANVFRQAGSRGFLLAGAHRNANGQGSADVAHLEETIFHEVHIAWNGVQGENTAWSIHGFDADNHAFPLDTDVVLSNGDGGISGEILALDDEFEAHNFLTFAYNTLPLNNPLNVAVNDNIAGSTFSSLAGTTNVQGIHSRGLGGQFVHIEMEQSIRFNANNRLLAGEAIAAAILATSLIPEPSSISLGWIALGSLGLFRRRSRQIMPACHAQRAN